MVQTKLLFKLPTRLALVFLVSAACVCSTPTRCANPNPDPALEVAKSRMALPFFENAGVLAGIIGQDVHKLANTLLTSTIPMGIAGLNQEAEKLGNLFGVVGSDLQAIVHAVQNVINNGPPQDLTTVSPQVAALVVVAENVKREVVAFICAVEEVVRKFLVGPAGGLDDIAQRFYEVLTLGVQQLKQAFPPPSQALCHEERKRATESLLNTLEGSVVHLAREFGLFDDNFAKHVSKVKEIMVQILVTTGDLSEQHPDLALGLVSLLIEMSVGATPLGLFLLFLIRFNRDPLVTLANIAVPGSGVIKTVLSGILDGVQKDEKCIKATTYRPRL